eukprot:CAMPEP_0184855118 /NCGR_PEP_ID=MMETSP0580-20130426/440_1 /TAXON_ID=1118495 /ORGANISM="Dactyliosolen fragilissimus" /LENGTH=1392 /DNA_ID=CAMNT_0027349545 /DNA_START=505 /DNA_END=4683 /DNA_ORIENTATION=-
MDQSGGGENYLVDESGGSLYHAYASTIQNNYVEEQENIMDIREGGDQKEDGHETEMNRSRKITLRHQKWFNFITQVLSEESESLQPLYFTPINGGAIIIHENITSIMQTYDISSSILQESLGNHISKYDEFDLAALDILDDIRLSEKDSDLINLAELESLAWNAVSSPVSLISYTVGGNDKKIQKFVNKLESISKVATDQMDALSFSPEDIKVWLANPYPSLHAAKRLNILEVMYPAKQNEEKVKRNVIGTSGLTNSDTTRLTRCSCIITQQTIYALRKLALARIMLINTFLSSPLFGINSDSYYGTTTKIANHHFKNDALRAYFHTTAIAWANLQKIGDLKGNFKAHAHERAHAPDEVNISSSNGSRALPDLIPKQFVGKKSTYVENLSSLSQSPVTKPPGSRRRMNNSHPSLPSCKGDYEGTLLEYNHYLLARSGNCSTSFNLSCFTNLGSTIAAPALSLTSSLLKNILMPSAHEKLIVGNKDELLVLPSQTFPNKSQLALRLHASYLAFPPSMTDLCANRAREDQAATYLLAEVTANSRNGTLENSKLKELLDLASSLLAQQETKVTFEEFSLHSDEGMQIFSLLQNGPEDWVSLKKDPSFQYSKEDCTEKLVKMFQSLLDPMLVAVEDLERMAIMQTTRNLFIPWITISSLKNIEPLDAIGEHLQQNSITSKPNETIRNIVMTLVKLSNLLRRVSILETYVGTLHANVSITSSLLASNEKKDIGAIKVVLDAIDESIFFLERNFHVSDCNTNIPEFHALWSSAFRHSILGHSWEQAYRACLCNPIKERRVNNLRRLTLAAVDSGAFLNLVKIISTSVIDGYAHISLDVDPDDINTERNNISQNSEVNGGNSGEIDVYELMSETLADASYERPSTHANYEACLYALHASRNNWRRCAQAMDLYGIVALGIALDKHKENLGRESPLSLISSDDLESSSNDQSKDLNAIFYLSLSSIATHISLNLVPNPNERFIVSGELGPYSIPALLRDSFTFSYSRLFEDSTRKQCKRAHDRSLHNVNSDLTKSNSNDNHLDRISRLITVEDTQLRAEQSAAQLTLYSDGLCSDSLLSVLQSSDLELIDALACLGYYRRALQLSYASVHTRKGDSCEILMPSGREPWADRLSYVLREHVAPLTVILSRPTPFNTVSASIEGTDYARPTFKQLEDAYNITDKYSFPSYPCDTWRSQLQIPQRRRGMLSMGLLEKWVLSYSNRGNSLALEVADTLLDLDEGRSHLPSWLMKLLTHGKSFLHRNEKKNGLFGFISSDASPSKDGCDPAGLVRILLQHGSYAEACEVVCTVLIGTDQERQHNAPFRLPEKGNIDFIPYDLIDNLWHHIEVKVKDQNSNYESKTERFEEILSARTKMEKALEKHFELMKISEIGMQSARALTMA